MESELLIGLLKIMLINIVLSGDNAVVIALACRNLPQEQQNKAVFWGSFGAIGLRVVLTFIAVSLLKIPFVQIIGGLLLVWIAVNLLRGDGDKQHVAAGRNVMEAIRTIIVADFVMSLDNVVAVAGAAHGNILLIFIGLAVSIPLIIWGSQLLMKLMNRFPVIIVLGAGLLGYTAGEMMSEDKAVSEFFESLAPAVHIIFSIALTLLVIALGKLGARTKHQKLQEN